MSGKAEEPDDDFQEEAPDWWLGKSRLNERILNYNVRTEETPGGMKVRFKIRVASGARAREIDAPGESDHGGTRMDTTATDAAGSVTAIRPAKQSQAPTSGHPATW